MKKVFHHLKPVYMRIPLLHSLLCLLFLAFGQFANAQCTPDTEAPISVCVASESFKLSVNQTGTLLAATLDDGSFDNCSTNLSFYINDGLPTATIPTATSLEFDADDIGTHDVTLWIVDEAGNYNYCISQISVMEDCGNGPSNPTLACNDRITFNLDPGDSVAVYPGTFLEGSNYCSFYNITTFQIGVGGPPGVTADYFVFDVNDEGLHSIQVRDAITGNSCWGELEINGPCVIDTFPPLAYCPSSQFVNVSNGDVTISVNDPGFNGVNECSVIERLELAPASQLPPTTTTVSFGIDDIGTNELVFWAIDEAGNYSTCTAFIIVDTCSNSPNLACNDLVTINVSPDGSPTTLYPLDLLEGGPYCENQYSLLVSNVNSTFAPQVLLDTSHVGTHFYQVTHTVSNNSCWGTLNVVEVDCNNDVTPPITYCLTGQTYYLESNGEYELLAEDLNAGSYDNCTFSLQYRVEAAPASPTPPMNNSILFNSANIGSNNLVLWAIDGAGNADYCEVNINISDCHSSPVMACSDGLVVQLVPNQPTYFYPTDLLEGGPYCLEQMAIGFAGSQQQLDFLTLTENSVGIQTVQVTHLPSGNSCWGTLEVISACANDTVPPTPVCDAYTVAQFATHGPNLTTLAASLFNNASYDNCSDIHFTAEVASMPSSNAPTATSVSFNAVGLYIVQLWVTDENGNSQSCAVEVDIIPPKCTPDQTDPYFTYVPADTIVNSDDLDAINIDPQDFVQLNQYFGEAEIWDYCGADTVVQAVNIVLNNCGNIQTLTRQFLGIDEAGNSTVATQTITVLTDYSVNLPADYSPGDAGDPQAPTFLQGSGASLASAYQDETFSFNCDTLPDLIYRTYTIIDWCNADPNDQPLTLDRRDQDNDGNLGDAFSIWSNTEQVYLLDNNGNQLQQLGNSSGLFKYLQIIRYNNDDTVQYSLTGTVFHDSNANCGYEGSEQALVGWKVKAVGNATGQVYATTTGANGIYEMNNICPDDTELQVSLDIPLNYGQTCQTTWVVNTVQGMPAVQHIPVQLDSDCPLMEVSLATPYLRRCFDNNYTVSYCNYSSSLIEDTWVEVDLDSFMEYNSSTIPGTLVTGNTYSFATGDLQAGQCGNFTINFDLSCEAELGQTHCTEAHIYPDTLCPQNANWAGANIEVEGNCINEEVHLTISNTGAGSMSAPLDYIVVEDVLMFSTGSFNLGAGQSMQLSPIPANGATWRLEAEQVPAHPYPGSVAVALEGCDGINELGLINLFPMENPNPFIAVDCQENQGSFDPNDKRAVPVGYGEEHFINRNTDIEYLIRFQNTGTDTAFTVVVEDALSPHFDPTSICPGASSHNYAFEVRDGNTVRFTFENIMLPDSNINLAASQGFVKFVAKQKPNVALGSIIENTAAIYFDFNDPITTNRVFHTIGEDFIEVLNSNSETASVHGQPTVFPNPAFGAVTFALPLELKEASYFTLHDQMGKLAHRQTIAGNKFVFERKGMVPGIYFYSIENEGVVLFTGKVVLK